MNTEISYIRIEDFPLKRRFTEDATKWTVLPEADLAKFKPLAPDSIRSLWRRFVAPHGYRQTLLRFANERDVILKHQSLFLRGQWTHEEEEQRVRSFLTESLSLSPDEPLYFFWGDDCGVETTWDIFVRYWSDFCYPFDPDNAAVPVHASALVLYSEERFWIVPVSDVAHESLGDA